ncbi:hypothetical protein Angca_001025, partial [Angiostrongylus cantonensis]
MGTPISMTIIAWSKQQTVLYNSLVLGSFGLIRFLIYAIFVYYDIGKICVKQTALVTLLFRDQTLSFRIDRRISTCAGMLALLAFHLITFPWWFLPGSIPYQEE